jgi:hypothetical protein
VCPSEMAASGRMFLRSHERRKDGKEHIYWSRVETVRTSGGPTTYALLSGRTQWERPSPLVHCRAPNKLKRSDERHRGRTSETDSRYLPQENGCVLANVETPFPLAKLGFHYDNFVQIGSRIGTELGVLGGPPDSENCERRLGPMMRIHQPSISRNHRAARRTGSSVTSGGGRHWLSSRPDRGFSIRSERHVPVMGRGTKQWVPGSSRNPWCCSRVYKTRNSCNS